MKPKKWKLRVPIVTGVLLGALSLPLLSLALFAQDRPEPRELLARASAAIFSAKTVRLSTTQSHGFAGDPSIPVSPFKMAFVRGSRGRAEWFFPAGNGTITLIVFDGANLWEYHHLGNQYQKTTASAWTFPEIIDNLDYGRNVANISAASYEDDETINFMGRPVSCWVVHADYRGAPHNRTFRGVMRRVWISKADELILRDYWETPDFPNARMASTTNYTSIETDVSLPDDVFVFRPPPGSKPGPPVVLGGVIGGLPANTAPPPPANKTEGKPDTPQRINVSYSVQRARLLHEVEPDYPPLATQARVQGTVKLGVIISKDGTIQSLKVISGHPLLVRAALDAVKQWVFEPAIVNGQPVEVETQIEFPFALK